MIASHREGGARGFPQEIHLIPHPLLLYGVLVGFGPAVLGAAAAAAAAVLLLVPRPITAAAAVAAAVAAAAVFGLVVGVGSGGGEGGPGHQSSFQRHGDQVKDCWKRE